MGVHVFAVVVDEQPSLAGIAQNTVNFAQSYEGIGPVISGFHGNSMIEEARIPRNLLRRTDDKHSVFEIGAVAASAPDHLVRNIHPDNSTFRHLLGKQA